MDEQNPFELRLTSIPDSYHAHHFHTISQLWKADSGELPAGAQGAMWLELINYFSLALLTLGLLISAVRLITLTIRARSHGNVHLQSDTAKSESGPTRKEAFAKSLIDNLDHDLGEDGEPLDLDAFWRSVSPVSAHDSALT